LNVGSKVNSWISDPVGAFVRKKFFGGYETTKASIEFGDNAELSWGSGAGGNLTDWVVVLPKNELSMEVASSYVRIAEGIGVENVYISTTDSRHTRNVTYTGAVKYYTHFSIQTNFQFSVSAPIPSCTVLSGASLCPR
jgi:hypothetical protein